MQFKPSFKKIIPVPFIMFVVLTLSNCGKKCNCDYEKYKLLKVNMNKSQVQAILNIDHPNKEKEEGKWLICTYKCEENFIVIELDKYRLVRTISFNTYPE